jgi:hypothetical protein
MRCTAISPSVASRAPSRPEPRICNSHCALTAGLAGATKVRRYPTSRMPCARQASSCAEVMLMVSGYESGPVPVGTPTAVGFGGAMGWPVAALTKVPAADTAPSAWTGVVSMTQTMVNGCPPCATLMELRAGVTRASVSTAQPGEATSHSNSARKMDRVFMFHSPS